MVRRGLHLLFLLILVGCVTRNTGPGPKVTSDQIISSESVIAFQKLLETDNYHDIRRRGEQVFKEGMYVPNHQSLFADYPSQDLPDLQVRYDLWSIKGEAGMAWIHLFLEKETGKIIQFSAGDATF